MPLMYCPLGQEFLCCKWLHPLKCILLSLCIVVFYLSFLFEQCFHKLLILHFNPIMLLIAFISWDMTFGLLHIISNWDFMITPDFAIFATLSMLFGKEYWFVFQFVIHYMKSFLLLFCIYVCSLPMITTSWLFLSPVSA